MNREYGQLIYTAVLLCLCLLLAACGASGGGAASGGSTTQLSGLVMAGPANGSTVTIKTAAGKLVAGPVTTAPDGSYSVAIPDSALKADLVFEAGGGTFHDEATASAGVAMGTLSAYVAARTLAAGSTVAIDPSSTIVHKLIAAGKSRPAAYSSYSSTFGYKPDNRVKPAFANVSSAATKAERLAGLRAAAFSQLAKNLGIQAGKQFDLINAVAADLADGSLEGGYVVDGKSIAPDIANRLGEALLSFQQSSNNRSKLKADEIGVPPFYKVAYTESYKVEYLPGTQAAATGKTMFQIRLTNRSDGSAAAGKTVALLPYMYMSTKSHSTPKEAVIDNGNGTYSCTVYYVMPTAMSGVAMGLWELKVTVDAAESVKFFPTVGMAMGGTALAKLNGVIDKTDPANPVETDSIMGTGGKETRTWFLFNDGLTGMAGNYSFTIFLATKEMVNSMLTFPAVKSGDTLINQAGAPWVVNSVSVEMSTDKTTWIAATDSGNSGHWTAAGLTGPVSGTSGPIYVRLTVNGLQKTTDGNIAAAGNGYQTFTVTPMQ